MWRPAVAVLVLFAGIAGACSGDDDGGAAVNTSIPDDTTTSSSTTEPRTVAPDIIPTDASRIDEAYVEGVLDELYRVSGRAIQESVAAGSMTERALDLLNASHDVRAAVEQINSLAEAESEGFARYVSTPGSVETDVIDLLVADPSCVVAEIEVDSTAVLASPPDSTGVRTFLQLLPATDQQRQGGLNPTAWIFGESRLTFEGEDGDLPCP